VASCLVVFIKEVVGEAIAKVLVEFEQVFY
jgi:hypothetical protein